jgi:hypothetical protein
MKKLANLKGVKALDKQKQRTINGGGLNDCPSGCFSLYFQGPGNQCAVPSPSGMACFGTIQNGQCCL